MKNVIIGTAGHVDHGKTQLIKSSSGIDTDRLSEEKKRGITIELGSAHIDNAAIISVSMVSMRNLSKYACWNRKDFCKLFVCCSR